MATVKTAPNEIDSYIDTFPAETRKILFRLRAIIRKAAPGAAEKISYGVPTYFLEGNLIHFAAYEKHIGLYPAPSGITAFSEELSSYKGGKGSVRFPLDKPVPFDLVSMIVKFRVAENLEKTALKKKKVQTRKKI